MSSKSLLQLLSIGLLCLVLNAQGLKAPSFKKSPNSSFACSNGLYTALVTGDKSGVSRKTVETMKDFGLMHLMTPSGLHLGSLLLVFKFFPRARFLTVLLMLAGSLFVPGFLALKRMLVFYVINYRLRNIRVSFCLTLLFCLISGNYQESPLSFSFTAAFWGTIVFHTGSKKSLAISLFAVQAVVAMMFEQEINLAAIVVNPLASAAFTVIFPALLFLYPVGLTRSLGSSIVELMESSILSLEALSIFNQSGIIALCFAWILISQRKKTAAAALLLISFQLNQPRQLHRSKTQTLVTIPASMELVRVQKRKSEYVDRKCALKAGGNILCRMKKRWERPSL